MNMYGLRIFYSVIFVQCLVFPLASASQAGSCFSSSFSRAIGCILRGFLLGEMKVATVIECKKRCVISANCLSLNILTNGDGSFMCQLNSDVKENGVKEQFVQHGSGEYYGLKVRPAKTLKLIFRETFLVELGETVWSKHFLAMQFSQRPVHYEVPCLSRPCLTKVWVIRK